MYPRHGIQISLINLLWFFCPEVYDCLLHHSRRSIQRGWRWQTVYEEGWVSARFVSRKFIPSLQAALNVCSCSVFGQRCLMACHSLRRQYYTACSSTKFPPDFLPRLYSLFCHIRLYWTRNSLQASPGSVAACLFTVTPPLSPHPTLLVLSDTFAVV